MAHPPRGGLLGVLELLRHWWRLPEHRRRELLLLAREMDEAKWRE
ncbi:hypothetical protein [Roseomonas chloroacetimidivorans]